MARFAVVDRDSLEKILKDYGEEFSSEESDLVLAHRVDDLANQTPIDQQPELVKLRLVTAALNIRKAVIPVENSDPPRAFYLDNTPNQLKQLCSDLGIFAEEALRIKIFDQTQVYSSSSDWDQLLKQAEELDLDPKELLLELIKPKLYQALMVIQQGN